VVERPDGMCPVCEERLPTVTLTLDIDATTEVSSHHEVVKVCQRCAEDMFSMLESLLGVNDAKPD
jgi:C4-type Zn-finger protein